MDFYTVETCSDFQPMYVENIILTRKTRMLNKMRRNFYHSEKKSFIKILLKSTEEIRKSIVVQVTFYFIPINEIVLNVIN